MNELNELVAHLETEGVLHSTAIRSALLSVDRAHFVPVAYQRQAYEDTALPLPAGQTVSQPRTVVFMLELLDARTDDHVLDIGYGSAWQTALLAQIVGAHGQVFAVELIPELCVTGKMNVARFPQLAPRVEMHCGNGHSGFPQAAPYDRIIAAAEVLDVPEEWQLQLKPGGTMVFPKDGAVVRMRKHPDGSFQSQTYPGFSFVPFVHDPR